MKYSTLVLLFVLVFCVPVMAQENEGRTAVAGSWKWERNGEEGNVCCELHIQERDGGLEGTYKDDEGLVAIVDKVAVNENMISATLTFDNSGSSSETRLSGTLEGDKITGKMVAGSEEQDWNAKRFISLADATGKWRMEFMAPDGSRTVNPEFVLKNVDGKPHVTFRTEEVDAENTWVHDVKFMDGWLAFDVELVHSAGKLSVKYDLEITGDEFTGSMYFEYSGIDRSGDVDVGGQRITNENPADEEDEQEDREIVSQFKLSKKHRLFACGPSSIYNWLSHGGTELQEVLSKLAVGKTPLETVEHIIDTYGTRSSLFNNSKPRYSCKEPYGGTGPINQLAIAQDILREQSTSPPQLSGEFLHRHENESSAEHLNRVTKLFSTSIESGVPVLLHVRGYRLNPAKGEKRQILGHKVRRTSVEPRDGKASITCVEPSGGVIRKGYLRVAEEEFTAPTYTWRLRNGRASQSSKTKTGRPLLVFDMPGYAKPHRDGEIVVANFATFAKNSEK